MTTAGRIHLLPTTRTRSGFMLVALLLGPSMACAQGQDAARSPYFGQPSPGRTPALFAPERFRDPGEYHGPPVFSADLSEAYWTPMPGHGRNTALMSRRVGDTWGEQRYETFGLEAGATEVTFSPDGTRIFFLSRQPREGERLPSAERQFPERIWFAPRTGAGIGTPRPMPERVFRHPTHWAFSVAESGNLYFTSRAEVRAPSDIYMAPFDGTTWGEPRPLGSAVNSGAGENCPFVAPDESYLLFTRIDEATSNPDLFISYREPDGSWSEAQALPSPINSGVTEIYPVVSPDGRYLFFLSWREGAGRVFWVEADVLRRAGRSGSGIGPELAGSSRPGYTPR